MQHRYFIRLVLVCAGVLHCKIRYSEEIQDAYVNSKYVIPFMLAAGLFYAFNYNITKGQWILYQCTQIHNATDIINLIK
jgi:hypothetical protein